MNRTRIALTAALFAAAGAQAQLLEPAPAPAAKAETRSALDGVPSFPRFHAGNQGLPPADPLALDLYGLAPKLYAGVDFNSYIGIETTFTNPDYFEGMRFKGFGPRLAAGVPMGVGGYNLETVARLTVPVDDRLSAFGELGVSVVARKQHDVRSMSVGPAASVGATYKMNSRQTVTAEVPLGAIARRVLTGSAGGLGGHVKLGF